MNGVQRLRAATAALRVRYTGRSELASETERRVLRRVAARGATRRRRLWLLPLAAVLAASSAWAGASGWSALTSMVRSMFAPQPGVALPPAAQEGPALARSPAPQEAAAAPVEDASVRDVVTDAPASALVIRSHHPEREGRHSSPARVSKPAPGVATDAQPLQDHSADSGPVVAEPSVEALYRQAHRHHFVEQDPAAALAAWDRYLARAQGGALVLEARYNRALSLVRLRRTHEAVEALTPFSQGIYGSYRQSEATALIRELSRQ